MKGYGANTLCTRFSSFYKDIFRGIIQWQYHGLQNRSWGFESLFPCYVEVVCAKDACMAFFNFQLTFFVKNVYNKIINVLGKVEAD